MPVLKTTEKLTIFTPRMCRILARKKVGKRTVALSTEEIADASGMTVPEVHVLMLQRDWTAVPVGLMVRFMRGCGVDIDSRASMIRHRDLLRKSQNVPLYLRKSPEWPTLKNLCE